MNHPNAHTHAPANPDAAPSRKNTDPVLFAETVTLVLQVDFCPDTKVTTVSYPYTKRRESTSKPADANAKWKKLPKNQFLETGFVDYDNLIIELVPGDNMEGRSIQGFTGSNCSGDPWTSKTFNATSLPNNKDEDFQFTVQVVDTDGKYYPYDPYVYVRRYTAIRGFSG